MSWIENPGETSFNGLDLTKLGVDEAYLVVHSEDPAYLYELSDDCYKCPFVFKKGVDGKSVLKVSTKHGLTWRFTNRDLGYMLPYGNSSGVICESRAQNFGEFGVYDLTLKDDRCSIQTSKPPVNTLFPLLLIGAGILVLAIFAKIISLIYDKLKSKDTDETDVALPKALSKSRLKSLDTFRGLSIVLMIFVNDGAGHYWFFEHATWNGLQIADLVFPWFLWIMGVCIPLSVRSQLKKKVPRIAILQNILRRSLVLFLLGVALNTVGVGPDLYNIRVFGVLQRFAVCYLVVAVIVTLLTMRPVKKSERNNSTKWKERALYATQWLFMGLPLAGYIYLNFFFDVPGCPRGYAGPGGVQYDGKFENCTGGVAGYVDKVVLGSRHLYQRPTASEVYKAGAFDPEGIFGCLTSIIHVFLGVHAGVIINNNVDWLPRIKKWLISGVICGVIGLVLCQARQEGGWVPLNKNVWSISFVLVTSFISYFLLSFIYYIVDVKSFWSGSPFFYPGMNAIVLYVGHMLCYNLFPWHWTYGRMNTHFMLTLEALWGTFLWILIAAWLYSKKFFLAL